MGIDIQYMKAPKISKAASALILACAEHSEAYCADKPMTVNEQAFILHQTFVQALGLLCVSFTHVNINTSKKIVNKQNGGS